MPVRNPFEELAKGATRYSPYAYEFVMDALSYVIERNGERRHISGRELVFGARDLALQSWGAMARHVLDAWGVRSTDDIGEIVFLLVNAGILSKTDEDRKEDFRDLFSFNDAFRDTYFPELDEHGRLPGDPHLQRRAGPNWASLFGPMGLN